MGGKGGFTLSELLVSVGILALLGALLVGILKSGLDTWDRGENRRDTTERSQIVLGEFLRELPRIHCEMDERPPASTPKPLAKVLSAAEATAADAAGRPALLCDFDRNGNQRIRFTLPEPVEAAPVIPLEEKNDAKTGAKKGSGTRSGKPPKEPKTEDPPGGKEEAGEPGDPPADYRAWTDQLRSWSDRAYVLEPTAEGDRLWRVSLPGPAIGETAFPDPVFGDAAALAKNGSVLASGVLYLRYRFWCHTTASWDTRTRVSADPSTPGGPEVIWDSTRQRMPEFAFYLERVSRQAAPPDILPMLIQVELTVRPETRRRNWGALREDVGIEAKEIEVDSTLGFPDAPAMLRIDQEWISYREKTRTRFVVGQRGIRETRAVAHKAGARALWGETVLTVVPVRNFRPPRDLAVPAAASGGKKEKKKKG